MAEASSSSSSTSSMANGVASKGQKSPANGSSLHPQNGSAKRPRGVRRKTPQPEIVSKPLNMATMTTYILEHQLSLSAIPIAVLLTLHFSTPVDSLIHAWTSKFVTLSYYNPSTGLYGKGTDDAYLVGFSIILLTLLRVCIMDYVARPYAQVQGMSKKGSIRFSEQAWSFVYYTVSWGVGMKLLMGSKYWFNFQQLWTDWPLRELDGTFKLYYLVQASSWLQQIYVLHVEARRKDHYQMFAHHIITCALVYCSYVYHMTRIGHVILCLFDVGDILLPAAKMLKYLKFQTLCDGMFGLFLLSWVIARHVFFVSTILSAHTDSIKEIPFGCFESDLSSYTPLNETSPTPADMFIRPQQTVCFNRSVLNGFIILLWALQALTCAWFYLIMKVAIKVVTGVGAEDNRSDDEEEEEIEELQIDIDGAVNTELKLLSGELAYAEASGSSGMGSGAARKRRDGANGTPLRDVFIAGIHGQSQFGAAQKLAESKIGCGGDDR